MSSLLDCSLSLKNRQYETPHFWPSVWMAASTGASRDSVWRAPSTGVGCGTHRADLASSAIFGGATDCRAASAKRSLETEGARAEATELPGGGRPDGCPAFAAHRGWCRPGGRSSRHAIAHRTHPRPGVDSDRRLPDIAPAFAVHGRAARRRDRIRLREELPPWMESPIPRTGSCRGRSEI